MKILSLDTTATIATAAVCEESNGIIGKHAVFSVKNGMTHSESLLPLIDSALNYMNLKISDIDLIGVTVGPGSFTGVRIGVATVKGLAYTKNIPVCAVSTPEAIAKNVVFPGGIVLSVMDARRHQFYFAVFAEGKRLTDDDCLSFEEIYTKLKEYNLPVIVCGDGAGLFMSLCEACGSHENIYKASAVSENQNALSVAEVAIEMFNDAKYTSGELLRPVYLRQSQAERERQEKENQ